MSGTARAPWRAPVAYQGGIGLRRLAASALVALCSTGVAAGRGLAPAPAGTAVVALTDVATAAAVEVPGLAPAAPAPQGALGPPPGSGPLRVATATAPPAPVARNATGALDVPVLMYHYIRVNPVAADALGFHLSVPPDTFAAEMALLHEAGFTTVRMDDVMSALQGGPRLPPHPVVLTFDDGYQDFATQAVPVLRHLGLAGTDYVVPGFLGRPGYMTLGQLQQVVREGMWIGAHTMFHLDLAAQGVADQAQTIAESRRLLRAWTGQPVESFAYPYGSYSAVTPGLVAAAGFTNAATTQPGRTMTVNGRYTLPRVRIDGGDTIRSFASKLGIPLPPDSATAFWSTLHAAAYAARHGGAVALLTSSSGHGYGVVDRDGRIHAFGDFVDQGQLIDVRLAAPIVGAAMTPSGNGYWLVGADGGVFPFGDAGGYGSTGGLRLNRPITGVAAAPDGRGYWLVASDGGIFPFGPSAPGYGSTGGIRLNQPVVGMAAVPGGGGYWLVASDGGIFPFGPAAPGYGSTGSMRLNQPIVGMAAAPLGAGYWLLAADGGIFPFGPAAAGYGSTGNLRLNEPMVAMSVAPAGGYWMVAVDGGIFPFGPGAAGFGSAA